MLGHPLVHVPTKYSVAVVEVTHCLLTERCKSGAQTVIHQQQHKIFFEGSHSKGQSEYLSVLINTLQGVETWNFSMLLKSNAFPLDLMGGPRSYTFHATLDFTHLQK